MNSLELVKPTENDVIVKMNAEALGLLKYAEQRVIVSDEDVKEATIDLSMIAKLKKVMEEQRKSYLKPFQDHIKEVNDGYKKLMEPVEQADEITRRKILDYQNEQEKKRAEVEEINRLRMEAAQKEAALNDGVISEPVNLVPEVAPLPKSMRTQMGTATRQVIKKWRVVDFKLIPDEYKVIDGPKITKLVKAGIGSIPGIEIYEEQILSVRALISE